MPDDWLDVHVLVYVGYCYDVLRSWKVAAYFSSLCASKMGPFVSLIFESRGQGTQGEKVVQLAGL